MKKFILILFVFTSSILLYPQQDNLSTLAEDEEAIKSIVKSFVKAAGAYDFNSMAVLFAEKANIGGASLRNGEWVTSTMTLEEFIVLLKTEETPTKYKEPISKFVIHISEGRLAFVKADAKLIFNGQIKRTNFDYFTLIKQDDGWKILNGSYVSIPAEE